MRIGNLYENKLGDTIVPVVKKKRNDNCFSILLCIYDGYNTKRFKYGGIDQDNILLGNYLDFEITTDSTNKYYVAFRVEATGNGHGTILLKELMYEISKYEREKSIKIEYAKGVLSIYDKENGNWEKSLPFYENFYNTYAVGEERPMSFSTHFFQAADGEKDIWSMRELSYIDLMNDSKPGCVVLKFNSISST